MDDQRQAVITIDGLARLIEALREDGFRVIGPTRRDDAIVYDDIETVDDLPAGIRRCCASGGPSTAAARSR